MEWKLKKVRQLHTASNPDIVQELAVSCQWAMVVAWIVSIHEVCIAEVLREQIKKYRDKFEVSLARVAEIDDQMKRYLGTEMSNPGNIPAVGQGKGNHYIIM